MVTPADEREAVAHLQTRFEMSERRACRVAGCCRMTVRYRPCREDGPLRERLCQLAHQRRRFGYRRLHVLLRREGFAVNHKRVFRVYREEKLGVRRRKGRKRAMGPRLPMAAALAPNARWSLDFVHDQMTDGRRFRILGIVDDCTRECLGLIADTSIGGRRVARELDRIIAWRGKPASIVSDNGTELTSNAILAWAEVNDVAWHYIEPGKPTQNAFIEPWLADAYRLRRTTPAKGFPAAPLAKLRVKALCSHRPIGQYKPSGSPHRWIKVGGSVTPHTAPMAASVYMPSLPKAACTSPFPRFALISTSNRERDAPNISWGSIRSRQS
jgi:putative transposase